MATSQEQIDQILNLFKDGCSHRKIERLLGVPRSTVGDIIRREIKKEIREKIEEPVTKQETNDDDVVLEHLSKSDELQHK